MQTVDQTAGIGVSCELKQIRGSGQDADYRGSGVFLSINFFSMSNRDNRYYDYIIVNDRLPETVKRLEAIMLAKKCEGEYVLRSIGKDYR